MINDGRRPSALAGFWTLLVGGAAIVLLLLFLHPVTQRTDCPNYGGNGNASAFRNPSWDLYFPLVLLAWIVLIAIEQVLPSTWRGRGGLEIAARTAIALVLPTVGSCCLFVTLATVCH
ncbi:hypothetical protein ACQPZX_32340 [Actinoplanes sp. CA-142083]|uniref:hypothetical protein n=1 Tax=Actinoplanes sp. CA-142083 TaxID=3239903 RepID=UPI003D94A017